MKNSHEVQDTRQSSFSSFAAESQCDLESLFRSVSQDNGASYFFIGNLRTHQFYVSDNMKHDFGFSDNIVDDFEKQLAQLLVDDQTRLRLYHQVRTILADQQEVLDMRFRIKDVEGYSFWVRCYGIIGWNKDHSKAMFFSGRIQHQDAEYVYDPITSFPQEHLALMRLNAIEKEGIQTSLIGFDIHGMREINNTMGRSFGDRFLKSLANALLEKLSDRMYFYRLNGMQFMAIVRHPYEKDNPEDLIEEIRKVIDSCQKMLLISWKLNVGFSLIRYPDETLNQENVLETILTLTRYSRNELKHNYIEYSFENILLIQKMADMTLTLCHDIADGMHNFHSVVQPLVNPVNGQIIGGEVLTRWRYEDQEISPEIFIPIIEKENLIVETGRWVFTQTLSLFQKVSITCPDLFLTFNVSYHQLIHDDLVTYMEQLLSKAAIHKRHLIAELTESANARQSDQLEHFMVGCRKLGIDMALDDFGTGYSSINMLLKYPFRIIKLARELIVESTASVENRNFINAIVSICQQNGKKICAEGVETVEQYETVTDIGADYIQGFYFHKPMDSDTFLSLLCAQKETVDRH